MLWKQRFRSGSISRDSIIIGQVWRFPTRQVQMCELPVSRFAIYDFFYSPSL
jgi:hypothetical protein